jgi:hypothetical protein
MLLIFTLPLSFSKLFDYFLVSNWFEKEKREKKTENKQNKNKKANLTYLLHSPTNRRTTSLPLLLFTAHNAREAQPTSPLLLVVFLRA